MLVLIKKENLTYDEKLELVSPLVLNRVDKKAYTTSDLVRRTNPYSGFLQTSPNIHNKHLDIKDKLLSQYAKINEPSILPQTTKARIKAITHYIQKIVHFYFQNLVKAFKDTLDFDESPADEKLLLLEKINTYALEQIKKELDDESPSTYYCAPLCGLSLFHDAIKAKYQIALTLEGDNIKANFALREEEATLTPVIIPNHYSNSTAL